jgi:hypothetical protein
MSNPSQKPNGNPIRPGFFDTITEIIGWLQIAASPTIIGMVMAAVIYYVMPGSTGLVIAIIVAGLGLITGIIWATKVWIKKGTINFMAKNLSTPEIDKPDAEN